jgi:hypothetical protein
MKPRPDLVTERVRGLNDFFKTSNFRLREAKRIHFVVDFSVGPNIVDFAADSFGWASLTGSRMPKGRPLRNWSSTSSLTAHLLTWVKLPE